MDAVKIADANFVLDGPGGRFEAAFSTNLEFSGIDLRNANLSVDVMMPIGGARRTLHVTAPQLALVSQDGGALLLRFEKAEIMAKDLPWTAEDINGQLVWQADGLTAKVVVNRLINRQQPALVEPTRLSGNVAMADARIDFDLLAETEAAGAKGMIRLNAKGHHDRSSDRGAASIVVAPVVFQTQGAQPVDFFPQLGNVFSAVTGSVALSGSVLWHGVTLSPDLVVRFADVSSELSGARLSRVDSDIAVVSLWPPATPPGQVLKATVEVGVLPPSNVTLEFQLLPKPTLMVERMQISFAGGRISTSAFAIDPAIPIVDTVLQFEQVDLSEVLKLIGVDGLSGTGRIDGRIHLHLVQGHVRIDDGRLAASGQGVLHFRGDKLPKEITEAGESVKLALQAMADFHYESLTLELNESVNGEGTILLRVRGNNPAVLDGHPFNFNIKFESNFANLTDIAMRSMAAAQELLRRTERSVRQ
ncbi:MAG: YdbH domain-containing protein [Proteobacteria bacterium]|nr:YdbH domain-containing protein [Pseudomonadota bacterium]